jgi:hypothetical protein
VLYIGVVLNVDSLVKSRKTPLSVIPAKAGIQFLQLVTKAPDSGFHRSDDFLRLHQCLLLKGEGLWLQMSMTLQ